MKKCIRVNDYQFEKAINLDWLAIDLMELLKVDGGWHYEIEARSMDLYVALIDEKEMLALVMKCGYDITYKDFEKIVYDRLIKKQEQENEKK